MCELLDLSSSRPAGAARDAVLPDEQRPLDQSTLKRVLGLPHS
jgi:hypothetical protein